MITSECKKVERFNWGLTPPIHGNVIFANPSMFDSAKFLAQKLYDHGDNKGTKTSGADTKKEDNNKKNRGNKRKRQQTHESSKKQQTVAVHTATTQITPTPAAPALTTSTPARPYASTLPKCDKCNFHHNGACRDLQCTNCNRKGHTARYCRSQPQQNNQPNNVGASQACYGCGETGHYKRNCPKANNQNEGGSNRVLAMGQGEVVQDPSIVISTFPLNNIYACILFDSGAERTFVSHKFKHLLNQNPQKLSETFMVEMANGKTETTNDIFIGCTLTLNNHSFQINLMSFNIRIFDVIIGMDWLSPYHANIMCHEKVVCLHIPTNETQIIYDDKSGANLHLISCIKAQKFLHNKNHAFLAHVVDKQKEGKNIKDIPKVCNFPDVFPEDLPGIPPSDRSNFELTY
ncbi:uncharacterized protein LOC111880516 [Lactuca sativa]|uniref:uncharacterized protein LOC111880516 n=1 Tax=Lactuca sativa TaxID=4236 RepID=UPI000CD9B31E|nr:uncharacterized protein LOC111880516 [Lactuca sativa]